VSQQEKGGSPVPAADVVSVGLVTPVGLSAEAAAAAIAAGRNQGHMSSVVNKANERQGMHLVEEESLAPLDSALDSIDCTAAHRRMLRLGGPALAQALWGCDPPPPLLLALPEVPTKRSDPVGPPFISQLAVQAHVQLDEAQSATYRQGGAGALFALADALTLLAEGRVPHVVVGGIDTFLDFRRLCELDVEGRIYGPPLRLGFMPGEGAGFLLLRAPKPPPPAGRQAGDTSPPRLARVIATGRGEEKGHRYSKEPYRGEGLAEAVGALFAAVPPNQQKVRCVYAGFNGEDLPAKEWGVARLRNSERFAESLQFEHPADCIGDSGAALGAIMLGLAAVEIGEAHLPQPRPIWATDDPGPTLVWSTSDREPRAAALLQW
jgi:3-oxoacyl-[acyl-carrier-protein] synthase I